MAQQRQAKRTKAVLKQKRTTQKFAKQPTVPGLKSTGGTKPSRVATNRAYRDTYRQNPVYQRANTYDSSTYYDRRNRYLGSYEPPTYIYAGTSSFGMWDAVALYGVMNLMSGNNNHAAQIAYNQQNNPDYQAWRREAENLAKDNAELRTQLASLDAATAKIAATGVAPDPSKMADGVDSDLFLANAVRESALPELKVCTGSTSGAYYLITTGVMAPSAELVNIVPVTTAGTGQALDYISQGKCDAAWVQANGYWNYIEKNETTDLPFTRSFAPYREYVHLMCHEDGPDEISDLGSKHKIWFPAGSGAAVTMQDWIGEDSSYGEIQTVLNTPSMKVTSNEEALSKVYQDPTKNSCMMYVAAPGATEFMRNANAIAKAKKIVLIEIDDWDFNDLEDPSGADVYDFVDLEEKWYGNLTRQAGWVGGGNVQTLDVAADFIISTKWQKEHSKIFATVDVKLTALEERIQAVLKPTNR